MAYLDNFNPEKIDSVPEVRQQLRIMRKAIDAGELGGSQYLKYELVESLPQNPDSGTLYLIPAT